MRLDRQFGFSISEILVALGVASVVSLAGASLMSSSQQKLNRNEAKLVALELLQQTKNSLNSPADWQKTLELNSAKLDCLKNPSIECSRNTQLIEVYTSTNSPLFGPDHSLTEADSGFTARGKPCDSFDLVNGNDSCPLRVEVVFRPLCPETGECKNVDAHFEISVLSKTKDGGSLLGSTQALKDRVVKKNMSLAYFETCESIPNAQWVNGQCQLNFPRVACTNSNEFVLGFEDDGRPICGPMSVQVCPTGQVFRGIASDGQAICEGCTSAGSGG